MCIRRAMRAKGPTSATTYGPVGLVRVEICRQHVGGAARPRTLGATLGGPASSRYGDVRIETKLIKARNRECGCAVLRLGSTGVKAECRRGAGSLARERDEHQARFPLDLQGHGGSRRECL